MAAPIGDRESRNQQRAGRESSSDEEREAVSGGQGKRSGRESMEVESIVSKMQTMASAAV